MTCDWPLLGCDSCCDLDVPPDIEAAAQAAAIVWLWEATNRRFGNCPVEILPCMRGCGMGAQWVPYRTATGWYNVGCGTCGDSCSCSAISEFLLPTIGSVLAITSNGISLPLSAYRVDNMRRVVRLDGGVWPRCQDLAADPPTWTVVYIPGLPVPEMGQMAAASLACQIARKMCGQKCDLPSNTTQVTRQGVTITLEPGKMTGLWLVDQWIELVNRPVSRVWSPDLPVTRVVESAS